MLEREVWFVDFKFYQPPGCLPKPLCMAAYEMNSRRLNQVIGARELPSKPPYSVGEDSIFVSFAVRCRAYLSSRAWLGVPTKCNRSSPCGVVEPKTTTISNGQIQPASKTSSLMCCRTSVLKHIESAEKQAMREIAITGGLAYARGRNKITRLLRLGHFSGIAQGLQAPNRAGKYSSSHKSVAATSGPLL